ncbi:nuclear transport factor 2 family protein [Haladaptatus sp. NG-SE-30]
MDETQRLRRLEAREAIKELRARYCYSIDEQDWDAFYDLFVADPTLDFGGMGVYEGSEGLARFAHQFVEGQLERSAHMLSNPILDVDVDGNRATGRWYVESPITFSDGSGAWRQGWYEDEYRYIDGEWKIATIEMRFVYTADYDEGGWSDLRLR